jgi:hypothetical protein
MDAPPTQIAALGLGPATLAVLVRSTLDALPHPPGLSAEETAARQDGAVDAIARLRPRDPLEAFLAARIVALQYHLMEDLRCVTEVDVPAVWKLRLQGRAIAMSKLMDRTVFELRDRQTAPLVWPEMPRPAALLRAAQQLARPQPSGLVPAEAAEPLAQPAPKVAPASTPPQPPPAEGRHERRRRERAERHAAAKSALARRPNAAAAPSAGVAPVAQDHDMRQHLLAEVAARVAASTAALAA